MDHEKIEISDETRKHIIDNLVQPHYISTVSNTIGGKTCWRRTGITFETVSKVMVALGSIFSFSAGYYHDDTLSFISGSISCLSLACLQFSSFSYKVNKKQGEELNILLKKLKLDTVPSLARDEFSTLAQSSDRYRQAPRSSYGYDMQGRGQGQQEQHQQQEQIEMLMREYDYIQSELIRAQQALTVERAKNTAKNSPVALRRSQSLLSMPLALHAGDNHSLKSEPALAPATTVLAPVHTVLAPVHTVAFAPVDTVIPDPAQQAAQIVSSFLI